MAFFEDLGKKITETSQGVVQKTKDTAEVIKLNGMISEEEKNIANLYAEIGKTYFNLHLNSYEPSFENMILGIKNSQVKINDYSEQVKKLKGIVRCRNCGGDVPYGAPFCSTCGSKMPLQNSVQSTGSNNITRCVNCGAVLGEGVAFCTNCGTKAEPIAANQINAGTTCDSCNVCSNCGKEVAADEKFCTGCGYQVK